MKANGYSSGLSVSDLRRESESRKGQSRKDRATVKKWQCIVCGWIYDEAEGYEDDGIAPGTAWEDVPEDFVCPECGVGKEDFEMIEIG